MHQAITDVPMREALEFGLAHARGEQPPDRPPVRLFVMGQQQWRDFDSWPPAGYPPQRLHLQPGGGLAPELPGESAPDRYRYDPADPTPAAGGVRAGSGGRVDNTKLEARPDVLTYTTATRLAAADQAIHHDPEHPSAIILPIRREPAD